MRYSDFSANEWNHSDVDTFMNLYDKGLIAYANIEEIFYDDIYNDCNKYSRWLG